MSQQSPAAPDPSIQPGENAWIWLIKIVTGPLLLLILILHFLANHFLGSMASGLMTYGDVVRYFRNPVIPLIEVLFLVTVVTHSLIGLRGILLDMNPSRAVLAMCSWFLGLAGLSAVVYGTWLALTIASKGG